MNRGAWWALVHGVMKHRIVSEHVRLFATELQAF